MEPDGSLAPQSNPIVLPANAINVYVLHMTDVHARSHDDIDTSSSSVWWSIMLLMAPLMVITGVALYYTPR
jgi:thiosulfate reductase cytochrome b subunit